MSQRTTTREVAHPHHCRNLIFSRAILSLQTQWPEKADRNSENKHHLLAKWKPDDACSLVAELSTDRLTRDPYSIATKLQSSDSNTQFEAFGSARIAPRHSPGKQNPFCRAGSPSPKGIPGLARLCSHGKMGSWPTISPNSAGSWVK